MILIENIKNIPPADIYLPSNARSLLSSIASAATNENQSDIIYLQDYSPIPEWIGQRIMDRFPYINFIYRTDTESVDQFSNMPHIFPSIVRRNFALDKRNILVTPKHSRTPWLAGTYRHGYVFLTGMFTPKLLIGRCDKIILREEGLANYHTLRFGKRKAFTRLVIGKNPWCHVMGEERWVDEIEITRPEDLPNSLQRKARKLPFSTILENVPSSKRKKIFDLFWENQCVIKEDKTAIILTQPLDQTEHCTFSEKNSIYKEISMILSGRGYKVYVKPHPRELKTVDFGNKIPKNFPIEIWHWKFPWKFNLAVSLFSSALDEAGSGFSCEKVNLVHDKAFTSGSIQGWRENLLSYLSLDKAV